MRRRARAERMLCRWPRPAAAQGRRCRRAARRTATCRRPTPSCTSIAAQYPDKVKLIKLDRQSLLGPRHHGHRDRPPRQRRRRAPDVLRRRRPALARVAVGRLRDGVRARPADERRHRRADHEAARQRPRDDRADAEPGRLRRQPPQRQRQPAEARQLPLRAGPDPDAGAVRRDRLGQPGRQQQPQLPAVLGRRRLERVADQHQLPRRGAAERARERRLRGLPRDAQRDRRHRHAHAGHAAAVGAVVAERAAGDRGSVDLREPDQLDRRQGPRRLAARPVDQRLLRGDVAPRRSRPTTPTARSASPPRRRRAGRATTRTTRRIRP